MARKQLKTGRLVLGRKVGETIWIGAVSVQVARVDGDRVRLSIIAPPEIKVMREELLERPQAGDTIDDAE